jgi:Tfp pilus assembly protein PilF
MIRIITFIALFIVEILSAQSKASINLVEAVSYFNKEQHKEAKSLFEKEVETNTENWLPNYYLALIHTEEAFENRNDQVKLKSLLETAQKFQDKANNLQPKNAEVIIVQAMIHTGWVIYNPMVYGRELSEVIEHLYHKANNLEPNNPRVVLQKTQFEIGKAQYFGQDITMYCEELAKSIELFSTFKPVSSLHPSWGLKQANKLQLECIN